MTTTNKTIKIEQQPKYVYYIELDNKRIEVQRKISNPEHFLALDIPVYEWDSTTKLDDGTVETTTNYSVALTDYQANKPARVTSDNIESMLAQGLTAKEIEDKMLANYITKIQAKIAKVNQ